MMKNMVMAVALFTAIGCGASPPGMKSAPVSIRGKVSQAGQPLGNIAVSFHPLDHGHLKSLTVRPDGSFEGELISGTYAYSIAQSSADSLPTLRKISPQYLEPDLQRTITVAAGQELLIALD
jgi:hypothetical protein